MTIENANRRISHNGNGLTTVFAYNFTIQAEGDLLVILQDSAGVDATQVIATNYTVAGVGVQGGGNITMIVPPAALEVLSIIIDPDLTQLTDYSAGGKFPSESHEAALDKLLNLAKRTRDLTERTLTRQDGDVTGSSGGAFDAQSNKVSNLSNATLDTDAVNKVTMDLAITAAQLLLNPNVIVPSGADFLFDTLAYLLPDTGAVNRRLTARMGDILSVKDFDVKGDGVTDDRTNIQLAVNAARTLGRELYFPAGNYLIDSTAGEIDCDGVTMRGAMHTDGTNAGGPDTGSNFFIIGDAVEAAFEFSSGSAFIGLNFWYTNQPDDPTPVVFAPTLRGQLGGGAMNFVRIFDCVFFNSYIAIDFNKAGSIGHIFVDRCTIYGINNAIRINGNGEVLKITNCSFASSHFIDGTDVGGLKGYTRLNGSAIKFDGASGGTWIDNCQFFGYFKSIDYVTGASTAQHINNCEFGQALNAIYIGSGASMDQSNISLCVFFCFNTNDLTDIGYAINIDSPSAPCKFKVIGCHFAQTTGSHIRYIDPTFASRLNVVGNSFELMAHGQASGSHGAVEMTAPNSRILFTSNGVQGQANAFASGLLITSATVIKADGNSFQACNEAISVTSAGNVQLSDNSSFATVASESDDIGTVTQDHTQRGNQWDKPKIYTVTAAASITIPNIDRPVRITGATTIDTIVSEGDGVLAELLFLATPTLEDNTSGSGNLFLAGKADLTTLTIGSIVVLVHTGANVAEVSRSIN